MHGVVASPGREPGFVDVLDEEESWLGDGTVPAESAFAGWALHSTHEAVWNGHRHSSLIDREAFGHQLDAIYAGKSARATLADDEFGLVAPELAMAGEPFEIVATAVARGRAVRAALHPHDAPHPADWTELAVSGPEERRGSLTAGPGTWVLTVVADSPRVVQREVVMAVEA